MALETITLQALIDNLEQENGDYLTFATTTNIAANNSIISTTLKQYDGTRDGFFDKWWVYLNTTANPSVERKTGAPATTTYANATGTLTIVGAALSAEAAAATCYLTRYPRTHYKNAVLDAIKRIYPAIHRRIDNQTLVTGNILPDGSFESWSSATALVWYSVLSGVMATTSTAGLFRNGAYSAKYTAGAANDYFYINSNSYPRLLDLAGKSVSLYAWAYPEVADDAYIVIYTLKNDGTTAQTLTSTTTCAAGVWSQLELEDQTLNEDLALVEIRFKVATNAKYVYFDDACLFGGTLQEYLLPNGLVDGHISRINLQTSGYSNPICYDLNPFITGNYEEVQNFQKIRSGTYQYLQIPTFPNGHRLRLIGMSPLETLTTDTTTITIDSEKVPLLISLANYVFWKREAQAMTVQDNSKAKIAAYEAYAEYLRLLGQMKMDRPYELVKR